MSFNNNPLVSIVIPTYNRAHLISRAIASVLNQTYPNFELLIIDDGSTDNTGPVVASFVDPRIFYHKLEENRGVLRARNKGFDLMKGEYVCLLDSDDELLPEALQTVVEKFGELASLEVKFLWFDCIDAEERKLSGYGLQQEGFVSYSDYLCEKIRGDYFFALGTGLLKGKRFDERLYAGELILWLKLLRITRAYYVPKVLCKKYREHGERICNPSMATLVKIIPDLAFTREVFLNEFGGEVKLLCPKNYAQRLAGLGFWQLISGKRYQGIKTLLNSLKYQFSLKVFVVFLLSPFLFPKKIAVLAARKYFQFYSLWK